MPSVKVWVVGIQHDVCEVEPAALVPRMAVEPFGVLPDQLPFNAKLLALPNGGHCGQVALVPLPDLNRFAWH
ncbi:MAG: hypothetical protein FWG39_01155 [Alphaproteobacteria bacterium]|nr:hypothetical protein [Alphaproteobacteria bacterium]